MDSTDDKERRKSLKMIINSVGEIEDRVKTELSGVDTEEELWHHIQRIESGKPLISMEYSDLIRQFRNARAIIKSAKEELEEMN